MSTTGPFAGAARAWRGFFFEEVEPLPLGLLRAVFGLYLLYYWADAYPLLDLHYLSPALLDAAHGDQIASWSWMQVVPHDRRVRLGLYLLGFPVFVALAAGFQTRLASIATWLLNRAWMALPVGTNSGDSVVSILCFLLMIAALCGHAQAVYSVDAMRRAPASRTIPIWPLRLIQIQLVYIYFFSGFHKLASPDWYRGEALFYILQQREWLRVNLTGLTQPTFIGLASYATLLFELLLFPVLIWVRSLRPYVLGMGVLLHLSIALTLHVFVFGAIMPIAYLAFVAPRSFRVLHGDVCQSVPIPAARRPTSS